MKCRNSFLRVCVLSFSALCAGMVLAAPPTADPYTFCDFESNTSPATQFHSPAGGGTVTPRFANPHKTGLNTSNYVMKVVSPSGANYGGTIFSESHGAGSDMTALYGVDFVTGYDYVDFLIYREDTARIPQLKIVDQDDYGTDLTTLDLHPIAVNDDPDGAIQVGVWQKMTYSITRCHNTGINFIYIMPDREGQSTVYIDNIVFSKDHTPPTMVSATCGTSTPESITLNVSATDNLTDPVRRYMVSQDGTFAHAVEYIANTTGTSLTITGLLPSTTYTFTIWAKDDAGNVSLTSVVAVCTTADPTPGNWCEKPISQGGKTIKVSCIRTFTGTSPVTYTLLVESTEAMSGLNDGDYCYINGGGANTYQYGGAGNYTVSGDGKKITCQIVSSTDPVFYTDLGVTFVSGGLIRFSAPSAITWGACATDETKPVMGAVSCGTATASSIKLNVTATDDKSDPVTTYRVSVDGGAATNYTATAGAITIPGLTAETTYSFEVWAVDDAGNISANSTTQSCSTNSAPTSTANYCDYEITNGKTIYVSLEEVSTGNYRLTIKSDEVMTGLGGSFCEVNGVGGYALNASGHYAKSDGGHTITCDIASSPAPRFYTPLYVIFEIGGEVNFGQFGSGTLPAIVWGQCVADAEPPVMVSASVYDRDQTSVTLNVYATDDITNPVTDFCVSVGSASAGTCNDYTADGDGRITVTGLTPNTEYCFYVWAKDAAGNQSANYKVACTRTLTFSDSEGGTCDKAFTTNNVSIGKVKGTDFYTTLDLHISFLQVSAGQYKLIVALNGWSNAGITNPNVFSVNAGSYVYINNRANNLQLSTASVTNATKDTITITINSTTPPEFYTSFFLTFGGTMTSGGSTGTGSAEFNLSAATMNAETYGTCNWIIYHTGDTQKAGDRVSYAGGSINSPIQYRRRFTEGAWETLYLPFTVSSVQLTDGVDYVDLIAYTGSNKGSAHYFLRTFNGAVVRENFKQNWTNTTTDVPQQGTPYIIQFPEASGVFGNNYIVFNGASGQTIPSAYSAGATPPDDYFNYYGNNTMMPQIQSGFMLTADGLWFIATEGAVSLNPFECYVSASESTRSRMSRFGFNRKENPDVTTDIHDVPTLAGQQFVYSTDGQTLYVEALENITLRIYSAGGWLMNTIILRDGESSTIQLPHGVYILQSIGQTEKALL